LSEPLKKLLQKAEILYKQMSNGQPPTLELPSLVSSNIKYDPAAKQYVLGEQKIVRKGNHLAHSKRLAQLVQMMEFVKQLLETGKTATKRDVFYTFKNPPFITCEDQAETDSLLVENELLLECAMEDFGVFPEERSEIFGDLVVEYTSPANYAGKKFSLLDHPDGVVIGPRLASCKFVKTNADKVIAVEKGAIFTRFVEEEVWKKYNAIIIHTSGQAPRATRKLLHRLNEELKLPVYIFTDCDPWGMMIAAVIKFGSIASAHLRGLTTHSAEWIGVLPSDIKTYKLPSEKLTETEISRLYVWKNDPRLQDSFWQTQIDDFLKMRVKCELEAFSAWGLTFIVDKYLKDKIH
jgi:DNA topoisomerase-6 subunit A